MKKVYDENSKIADIVNNQMSIMNSQSKIHQKVKIYILTFYTHNQYLKGNLTRMTTFIKARLEKSDDQTNIDRYRVTTLSTLYLTVLAIAILNFKSIGMPNLINKKSKK